MFNAPDAGLIATSFRSLPAFGVTKATSVEQAIRALQVHADAAVLSGATDLVARFNEGFMPSHIVDINSIAELKQIVDNDQEIIIGAGVTHEKGSEHAGLRARLPGFAWAWSRISNVRIRMSATLGGNIMSCRTRYEGSILLSALAAKLRFSSPDGNFEMAAEDIWINTLPMASILTHIVIPLRAGLVFDYERSMRPIMTQALAIDGAGHGRIVTATEYVRPHIREIRHDEIQSAETTKHAYGDPVASDRYINQVSEVFLSRQLQRLKQS